MIEIENLAVTRSKKNIIKVDKLIIESGTFVAIAGLNGSGKTSLFNALCGFDLNALDSLKLNGKRVNRTSLPSIANHRAVVPQIDRSSTQLKVNEVLRMGLYQKPIPFSIQQKIVAHQAKSFGLSSFLNRNYSTLSGGEKQRTLIAQSLLQFYNERPEDCFIFLDEPTNNLDLAQQHLLMKRLHSLKKQGFGIVAVLHDLNQIRQFADRVLFVKDQTILKDGNPLEVLNSSFVKDVFGIEVYTDKPQQNDPITLNALLQ